MTNVARFGRYTQDRQLLAFAAFTVAIRVSISRRNRSS